MYKYNCSQYLKYLMNAYFILEKWLVFCYDAFNDNYCLCFYLLYGFFQ